MFAHTPHTQMREREAFIFDAGNLDAKLATITLGPGTGLHTPFYDPDTNVFVLTAKVVFGDLFMVCDSEGIEEKSSHPCWDVVRACAGDMKRWKRRKRSWLR